MISAKATAVLTWTLSLFSLVQAESSTFTIHKAIDQNGSGQAAVAYLLPRSWQSSDVVKWNLLKSDAPLLEGFVATSPDKHFSISFINEVSNWYTRMPSSTAAKSGGAPPPDHPVQIFLQQFQQSHPGVSYSIVEQKETPIASVFKPAATQRTTAKRCFLKLSFDNLGVPSTQEFTCDFQGYESGTAWGMQHGFSNGRWYLYSVMSLMGPTSQLKKAETLGVVTLSSYHEDPQFASFKQTVENGIALQGIQRTNEWLKQKYAESQEYFQNLSARTRQQFEEQQRSKEIFTRNMVDFASNRQRYRDGNTDLLVPLSVDRVMTNGYEYLITSGAQGQIPSGFHDLQRMDINFKQ